MNQPRYVCTTCGRTAVVKPDARGNPDAIARRRLVKACGRHLHVSTPRYEPGDMASRGEPHPLIVKLRALRVARGLTQAELAKLAGI